ncbi:MAG: alpha/beta hydrolase-fold protein [Bacteroidota bacterium]
MPNIAPKFLLNFFLVLPLGLWAQLILQVTSIPSNTPNDSDIYLAGDFNNWSPDNGDYILDETGSDTYEISLDIPAGSYEFKFTRGSWPTVEGTAGGTFRPNRQVTYSGGTQTETLTIEGWEDQSGTNGTAADNVSILSESFFMPQLNRNRRIWIYLPPDYATSARSYPVLYMHDGQNLFDDATSFSGEWGVDESLNDLFSEGDYGIIVIGIENGGGNRLPEYTPWPNPTYGGGEGSAYVDFIVETLKPYVDANYRTLPDQPNTGIMGSSLGGLISLYACIRHQDIFGRAGVLSPSLWFTDDIYEFVANTGKQQDVRIALLAGELESSTMVPMLQNMYNTLLAAGFTSTELDITTHADGEHSEWYWRREFSSTYQWLFQNISTLDHSLELSELRYWPNPAHDFVYLNELPGAPGDWQVSIYNSSGRQMLAQELTSQQIDLTGLPIGPYFILLTNDTGQWALLHLSKM